MLATFNKFSESGKTALVSVRVNQFELGNGTFVYIDGAATRGAIGESPEKGASFELPEGGRIVDLMVWNADEERTEQAKSKSGDVLQTLSWS